MNEIIVALDVETATPKRSSICEIGIAVIRNGEITEKQSWLIQPPGNEYSAMNIGIHGITPEDTKNSPLFPEVWAQVREIVENKIVVCHYSAFDMSAIRAAIELYGLDCPTFDIMCTIWPSKKTVPGLSRYTLSSIYEELFGSPLENHHRACDDAVACAKILLECFSRNNVNNREDIETIFQIHIGHLSPESYCNQHAMRLPYSGERKTPTVKASDIVGSTDKLDPDSYFYEKTVCFTGAFTFSVRKDLFQYIADVGGYPVDSVTKKTDILVVGQQDFRVVGESGMSSKQRKAHDLLSKGQDIEILSETDFLAYASEFGK